MRDNKPTYEELENQLVCLRLELEQLKAKERLHNESELKFRMLYENSLDAICVTLSDGRILSANSVACLMFGMTEEEICTGGRNLILDTNDPRAIQAIEHRNKHGYFFGELTFKRKEGTTFQGECSSKIFTNEDGTQSSSLVLRDITERKKTEQAMKESEEKFSKIFYSNAAIMA